MRAFILVLRTLLAMARHKPWEPLLIVLAIMVASGGLTAVLLINEGARLGDIASKAPPFFAGGSISARLPNADTHPETNLQDTHGALANSQDTHHASAIDTLPTDTHTTTSYNASTSAAPLTRDDYVLLRTHGFTQFVALVEDTQPLTCASTGAPLDEDITVVAIDFMAASNQRTLPPSVSLAPAPITEGLLTLAAPGTVAALGCRTHLLNSQDQALRRPISLAGLPEDVIVMNIRDYYTGQRHPDTHPLSRLVAITPLPDSTQTALKAALPQHLVYTPPSTLLEKGTLTESFRLNLWAMGVLMAVVALFIILNALLLMYRARLPAIIRLRQLGVASRTLTLAMICELGVYGLCATPIGVVVGVTATRALSPLLQQTLANLFDSAFVQPSPALLEIVGGAFAITFVALTVFTLYPALQLSQALSRSQFVAKPLTHWQRGSWSIIITALIIFAVTVTSSALMALVSVAFLLLGGAALIVLWLPMLTRALTYLAPPQRPLISYVVANTHVLSGKSRLAICAFFIALSANIGMNVMTDSFRDATHAWLEQRLSAPAYLYTNTSRPPQNLPDILNYQHVYRGFTHVNTHPVTLRSFPSDQAGRDSLLLSRVADDTASAWQAFASNRAIFINQQLAFRQGFDVGATLTTEAIVAGNGASQQQLWPAGQQFVVAGIYPDYGNPDSQILLPVSYFHPPAGYAGVTALYSGYQTATPKLAALGEVYVSEELLARSMQIFDRTFVITNALNVATLLVAALAFAVSVSVLTLDIKPQLSILRSFGVAQWRIKAALWGQYCLLCLLTAAIALPFGIGLAWLFINQVNRYAFFWLYPLHIDTHTLLSSVGVSLLVVLVILLLPVGRIKAKVDLRQEEAL